MGTLKIYEASAGSGKTYSLVKEYLSIILAKNAPVNSYRELLALTFTNKAASEMKYRVIKTLRELSSSQKNDMFEELMQITRQTGEELRQKSQEVLSSILHNYSNLSICTLDAFSTRIIRSFARDMKIPIGFDIIIDKTELLDQAVDMLLSRAGKDQYLTDIITDYLYEKIDEQSFWDIKGTLVKAAELSSKEKSIKPLKELEKLDLKKYRDFRNRLFKYKKQIEEKLSEIGKKACIIIEDKIGGYEPLYYGLMGIGGFFKKAANGDFLALNFQNSRIKSFVEEEKYSAGKATNQQKMLIMEYSVELIDIYNQIKELNSNVRENYLLSGYLIDSLKELSLLKSLNKEIQSIKERDNSMLIEEFNKKIAEVISEQPVAFIYEKIGEKYKHFFIDEFQDTSSLQWSNLKPLILNQLASFGSALIVGDGKQAIYRFRGGESELFLQLTSEDDVNQPYEFAEKKLINLDTNFRSAKNIVDFTNEFFTHAVAPFIENESHKNLYIKGNKQKCAKDYQGFVSIENVEESEDKTIKEIYLEKIIQEIRRLTDTDNFALSDICVLCQRNDDAKEVAQYLIKEGISVISSESLLISSSSAVEFLENFLKSILNSKDTLSRMAILNFLAHTKNIFEFSKDRAESEKKLLEIEDTGMFLDEISKLLNIDFSLEQFHQLSLYEAVEYLISSFELDFDSSYVIFFLDVLSVWLRKNPPTMSAFLEYWQKYKNKESIKVSEGENAVSILTIHKSKGLEFKVVILPFVDWSYRDYKEEIWLKNPQQEKFFEDMPYSYLSLNKVRELGRQNEYDKESSIGFLDKINLLYVAMTRAELQLHIITSIEEKDYKKEAVQYYFYQFLSQADTCQTVEPYIYSIGKRAEELKEQKKTSCVKIDNFKSSKWQDKIRVSFKSPSVWQIKDEDARSRGNKIHSILAEIEYSSDLAAILEKSVLSGLILDNQKDDLKEKIEKLFSDEQIGFVYTDKSVRVFNERDFLSSNGDIIRPDRVCFFGEKVIIIDYKSGSVSPQHSEQLEKYSKVFEDMGYLFCEKYLIYLDRQIPQLVEV